MSYSEVNKLPTRYRSWYIKRLVRYFKEKNQAMENARQGNQSSTGEESHSNVEALNKYQEMLDKKFG